MCKFSNEAKEKNQSREPSSRRIRSSFPMFLIHLIIISVYAIFVVCMHRHTARSVHTTKHEVRDRKTVHHTAAICTVKCYCMQYVCSLVVFFSVFIVLRLISKQKHRHISDLGALHSYGHNATHGVVSISI